MEFTITTLKLIAVFSMVVDHIGMIFFPEIFWVRFIGRLAFPIFAFCVVEGFYHTQNLKKYLLRLFIFACISEVAFDLVHFGVWFDWRESNPFFTLFLGLFLIMLFDKYQEPLFRIGTIFIFLLLAEMIHSNYGFQGILMILCFYLFREKKLFLFFSLCIINCFLFGVFSSQSFAVFSFLPIFFYHGKKGGGKQRFFYLIYPVHLFLFYVLAKYV